MKDLIEQLQAELDLPRILSGEDLAEVGGIDLDVRRIQICMVEYVEEFRAELQVLSFANPCVLDQRSIRAPHGGVRLERRFHG